MCLFAICTTISHFLFTKNSPIGEFFNYAACSGVGSVAGAASVSTTGVASAGVAGTTTSSTAGVFVVGVSMIFSRLMNKTITVAWMGEST